MTRGSYFEQFLNDLAEQMAESPSALDDPDIAQYMAMRQRVNAGNRMRNRIAPGPERGGTLAAAEGLGRIFGGGASLALTGDTNPLDSLRALLGSMQSAKEEAMTGGRSPLDTGMAMIPMRGALHGPERAIHGAEVRAELLAKRKQKGPRKPGGGRRPASKPEPTAAPAPPDVDLLEALAKSVPPVAVKRGGVSALLGRLRRGGR